MAPFKKPYYIKLKKKHQRTPGLFVLQRSRDWGSIPVGRKRFFFSSQRPDRLWLSPSLCSGRGVKRPGLETDYLPTSRAKVKIRGALRPPLHASSLFGYKLSSGTTLLSYY